jgi:ABC-type branched-subunit amino acid transport system substrate-binding protein
VRRYAIGLALGCASCSLGELEAAACRSDLECRAEFGPGSYCAADGFCSRRNLTVRCDSSFPDDLLDNPEDYAGSVVVGHLVDRASEAGVAIERAARLAAEVVAAGGGVHGRAFGVVYCAHEVNDDYDVRSADEATRYAARELALVLSVPAVVGPRNTDDVLVAAKELRPRGVLVMAPGSPSPILETLDPAMVSDDDPGLVWRSVPPPAHEGRVVARDLIDRKVARVALVVEVGEIAKSIADALTRHLGSTPVDVTASYDPTGTPLPLDAVSGIQGGSVVYVGASAPRVTEFLHAVAADSRFDESTFFLTSVGAAVDLSSMPPVLARRLRGTHQPVAESEAYRAFVSAYRERFGLDAGEYKYTANGYDAVLLVAAASAWALPREGALTGRSIARGLRNLSSGPKVPFLPERWNDVVTGAGAGSIDVEGASGTLDFDPTTEEPTLRIDVWEATDVGGTLERTFLYTSE